MGGQALEAIGTRIDLQILDGSTVLQRANNRNSSEGGWHIAGTFTAGMGLLNPSGKNFLRGSGTSAAFGWSDIPRLEELRNTWFQAPDEAAQAAICREIQAIAFETLPYLPIRLYLQKIACRSDLMDMQKGLPVFYGVQRA